MVKIFVGGLKPNVSELDLVMFISLRAQVNTIKVVRDKVTKRCKGYAFLEMANQAEAEKAVALLNGEEFEGQVVKGDYRGVRSGQTTLPGPAAQRRYKIRAVQHLRAKRQHFQR